MWNFFWFSFEADHFDFSGSQSIFGIPQDPPVHVYASLSQDGFCKEACGWFASPSIILLTSKDTFCACVVRRSLHLQNEKYVIFYLLSGQGSSLHCPIILILEYGSTGTNLKLLYPGWVVGVGRVGSYLTLLPQSD